MSSSNASPSGGRLRHQAIESFHLPYKEMEEHGSCPENSMADVPRGGGVGQG